MNREDPVALTIDYTRVMMAFLLFDQSPARIEMIGLGGGSLAKLYHCLLPDTDITVVEIDDKVIALREQFLVPPESDRFRVVYADGADHVRQSQARPNVLLVDGFDAEGQPPQLCSPLFYSRCYDRMTPGGLLIINLWGGDPDHRRHVGKLERHFEGDIIVLPTEGGTNRAIIARKDASLALTDTQSAFAHALFPQLQAAFLPSIGERLRRELDRRTSAML
jgi:spermidine synthase